MARIKASLATEREDFAFNLFKNNRDISVADVNDALQNRDGFKMNLSRIYAIRAGARGGSETVPARASVKAAPKKPGRKKTKATKRAIKRAA